MHRVVMWFVLALCCIVPTLTSNFSATPHVNRMHVLEQQVFSAVNIPQYFVVPSGVFSIQVDMTGAKGGNSGSSPSYRCVGASGARVQTTLAVTPGSTLIVYVGGAGTCCDSGYNGGGGAASGPGTAGGGASDIRTSDSYAARIVVAGGGGGCTYATPACDGSGGVGGSVGAAGATCSSPGGGGGTQTEGGATTAGGAGTSGGLGYGGNADYAAGGGGGGGYYGGGGGSYGGGGGGSSYSSGTATTITAGYNAGSGSVTLTYVAVPSTLPSTAPTATPSTASPTLGPTSKPPTLIPTIRPSVIPTPSPTQLPSMVPSMVPTCRPTSRPSSQPSLQPTRQPSAQPSQQPTGQPTRQPSSRPTLQPTSQPVGNPTSQPSRQPSSQPSGQPSGQPSCQPVRLPTSQPSRQPTLQPLGKPTGQPSLQPSSQPNSRPTDQPTRQPTCQPSSQPSGQPSHQPRSPPTSRPSRQPAGFPSSAPSSQPSTSPTSLPSLQPTNQPSTQPVGWPSFQPSAEPSMQPTGQPTEQPTGAPSNSPTGSPTSVPTQPSSAPSTQPTSRPSRPTSEPTSSPSSRPSLQPSVRPSAQPLVRPSSTPTLQPTSSPTQEPSNQPTTQPTREPSSPSSLPTRQPTSRPTVQPSTAPSRGPSSLPSAQPSAQPSQPSSQPTSIPSLQPSGSPSNAPSAQPNSAPTRQPSAQPSKQPTSHPSHDPIKRHGSLPGNYSISVVGTSLPFKIVLPYLNAVVGKSNGFTDIVVGATFTTNGSTVVLGSFSLAGELSLSTSGYSIHVDRSGRSVSALGDVNGDGFDDIIIGVPGLSVAYVMYGNYNGYVDMFVGFTIFGENSWDQMGWSVGSAGDVNNDGLADILIGAPNANAKGNRSTSIGAAYVIFGRAHGFSNLYLANITVEDGFAIYGEMVSDFAGLSVSCAGDVNADGYSDVVIGALKTSNLYAGAAYVIFGRRSGFATLHLSSLPSSRGFAIRGAAWQYVGYSVAGVGDVNNDGYDDVLLGSQPRKDVQLREVSYVLFGRAGRTRASVAVETMTADMGVALPVPSGMIVSNVGDVNSDGFSDMLLVSRLPVSDAGFAVVAQVAIDKIRSRMPVLLPTPRPSVSVSPTTRTPTGPTHSPSPAPSGPSVEPSLAPSREPSEAPTTMFPSMRPTYSQYPSLGPTLSPSLFPSQLPSVAPSRVPSYAPTLPHNVSYNVTYKAVIYTSMGGEYWRRNYSIHFVMNTSRDVIISGVGGQDMFSLRAVPMQVVTVVNFDRFSDIIDLRAFTSILHFSDLNITRGSAIIHLPGAQLMVLSNIYPEGLSRANFLFYVPPAPHDGKFEMEEVFVTKTGVAVFSVGCLLVSAVVFGFIYRRYRREKLRKEVHKTVKRVEADQRKLVLVQHVLVRGVDGQPDLLSSPFKEGDFDFHHLEADTSNSCSQANHEPAREVVVHASPSRSSSNFSSVLSEVEDIEEGLSERVRMVVHQGSQRDTAGSVDSLGSVSSGDEENFLLGASSYSRTNQGRGGTVGHADLHSLSSVFRGDGQGQDVLLGEEPRLGEQLESPQHSVIQCGVLHLPTAASSLTMLGETHSTQDGDTSSRVRELSSNDSVSSVHSTEEEHDVETIGSDSCDWEY